MILKGIFVFCVFALVKGYADLEVIPEKVEVTYINPKYITYANITMKRTSRRSPYYINYEVTSLYETGNNVTVDIALYENLSGRYIPTIIHFQMKTCDFYEKDPIFGQMFAKQFPKGLKCPFPAGKVTINNMQMNFQNFKFRIFTYSTLRQRVRFHFRYIQTLTKEALLELIGYAVVTQNVKKV